MNKEVKKIVEAVRAPLANEKEIKMVEIIMLKYKDPEVETRAVQHIIENTDYPFKLTVYDNRVNNKNISKIWNKLIKESTCDYVCILDSDAFVPPGWLTKMMSTFEKEDCYVVLPKVSNTSCSQQRADKEEDKEPEVLKEILAAQCVLYKKEIFEKIGYFDEDFLLYGQDSEWGDRLLKSKYKGYVRPDVLVKHVGSVSIKKTRKEGSYNPQIERIYAGTLFRKKTGR